MSRLTGGIAPSEIAYMSYRFGTENDFKCTTTLPEILRNVKARGPARRPYHYEATDAVFPRRTTKDKEWRRISLYLP